MDMEKVNSMDFGEFVDVFGNVIERCPLIAAAVWSQRPFSDLDDLEKHFSAFIDALPQSGEKIARYQNISGAQGEEQMADIFTGKGQFGLDCGGKWTHPGLKGQICHFAPRPRVPAEAERSWHRQAQGQEGILRCHPDLAGRELQRGTLTAESQREQSGAGLTHLGAEERRRLAELNARYRARFGFPFVLAARLSDRDAVPRELTRRLRCQPALELRTALGEVKKIGRLRLADLLGVDLARL
ncbi:putative 2-oxo-4-hydroxy-4-carboxy-5-ureidoimidazoline decarboxylase isoform X1 [Saccopteryx bilineata]|uniref:putative 2-oxo-4-hydroxy-4-carboxy-5-ureidoimidazoline decarboxylase isoform X1 n=1 Tax=Saccopteryx bilineata TaxID=59482 RepID=UPI00338E35E5